MDSTSKAVEYLNLWADFVSEVESGYTSSIDDYTNDLSVRNVLEQEIDATRLDKIELKAKLAELDHRFRRATTPDEDGLIKKVFEPLEGWWWSRLPRKIAGVFKATLPPAQP
jgi:hypothetical protein